MIMSEMNITSVQYVSNMEGTGNADAVRAVIDGETMSVPIDPANRHYAEILRQVEAGELTIADAE